MLLCFSYRLMSGTPWTETVAVLGELRVPSALQYLHHRLLNHAIQRCWNAELAHSTIRFGYLYPPYRLRCVSTI